MARSRRLVVSPTAIVAERKKRSIESTDELARLVEGAKGGRRRDHHPATQMFQALRIAVNQELDQLERFLADGYELAAAQRAVGDHFVSFVGRSIGEELPFVNGAVTCFCPPRTPICQCGWSQKVKVADEKTGSAGPSETAANPRARSAKLRAVERV